MSVQRSAQWTNHGRGLCTRGHSCTLQEYSLRRQFHRRKGARKTRMACTLVRAVAGETEQTRKKRAHVKDGRRWLTGEIHYWCILLTVLTAHSGSYRACSPIHDGEDPSPLMHFPPQNEPPATNDHSTTNQPSALKPRNPLVQIEQRSPQAH